MQEYRVTACIMNHQLRHLLIATNFVGIITVIPFSLTLACHKQFVNEMQDQNKKQIPFDLLVRTWKLFTLIYLSKQ